MDITHAVDVSDKWGEKMSRWIDADKLITELQKDEATFDKEAEEARNDPSYTECYSDAMWSRANGIRDAIIEVYEAPSIDIVRCSECKYWEPWHCSQFNDHTHGVDYCSYGERRE